MNKRSDDRLKAEQRAFRRQVIPFILAYAFTMATIGAIALWFIHN